VIGGIRQPSREGWERVIEVLIEIKNKMSDPDRVVLDPRDMFEDAEGNSIPWPGWRNQGRTEPERACVLGWGELLSGGDSELDGLVDELLMETAFDMGFPDTIMDSCTRALAEDQHLELLDLAILRARRYADEVA
jgi:hypothetical protein